LAQFWRERQNITVFGVSARFDISSLVIRSQNSVRLGHGCTLYLMLILSGGNPIKTGVSIDKRCITECKVSLLAVAVTASIFTNFGIKQRTLPSSANSFLNSSPLHDNEYIDAQSHYQVILP